MTWHQYDENPILGLGSRNQWDERYATWASVVRVASDRLAMYYSGKDKGNWFRSPRLRIGVAFSSDGLKWSKHAKNPIVDVGRRHQWDSAHVYCPIVWQENGLWNMIFTGCDARQHYQVGYAVSEDGLTWSKSSENPVFCDARLGENRSGAPETEAWGLLRDGSRYFMLYNTVTIKPRQIYAAESSDLVRWKPISDQPLIPSEGSPTDLGYMKYCAWPQAVNNEILVYVATSDANYTVSAIGLWKIGSFGEVYKREFLEYVLHSSTIWSRVELDTPFIFNDSSSPEGGSRLYFGGRDANHRWREGVAVSPAAGSGRK